MSHYLVQPLPPLFAIRQTAQARWNVPEADISVLRLIRENENNICNERWPSVMSAFLVNMSTNENDPINS